MKLHKLKDFPYDPQSAYDYYDPSDNRSWPFFVIDIPTIEGNGPASIKEADEVRYEVWDHNYNTYGVFDTVADALKFTLELIDALFSSIYK